MYETSSRDEERFCGLQLNVEDLHRASEIEFQTWAEKAVRSTATDTTEARKCDVCFENLTASGNGSSVRIQSTVLSALLYPVVHPVKLLVSKCGSEKARDRRTILHGLNGLMRSGDLLLVLGRPGSGCSTFLKVLCGYLDGLDVDAASEIQYRGIPFATMMRHHRGEAVYNQEADHHFPNLTVGQTLEFAAHARAPRNRLGNGSRKQYADSVVQAVMNTFGLAHTYETNVGNDYVPGVSGGERKRVR
jgi:ATP-binding cassette subfamily G (WHITE) protein 2 (PDR)